MLLLLLNIFIMRSGTKLHSLLKEKRRIDEAFNKLLELKRGAAMHTLESLMLLPVSAAFFVRLAPIVHAPGVAVTHSADFTIGCKIFISCWIPLLCVGSADR